VSHPNTMGGCRETKKAAMVLPFTIHLCYLVRRCFGSSSSGRFVSSSSRGCYQQQFHNLRAGLRNVPALALCGLQNVMVALPWLALGGSLHVPVALSSSGRRTVHPRIGPAGFAREGMLGGSSNMEMPRWPM
jgi:hypothetical protein